MSRTHLTHLMLRVYGRFLMEVLACRLLIIDTYQLLLNYQEIT